MQKFLRKKVEMHRKSSTNGAGNEGAGFLLAVFIRYVCATRI